MRVTRKVFTDLAIWQVGFGLCIGAGFPPFVIALGAPRVTALSPRFIGACLLAGATAGTVNQFISHRVVGARLRALVGSVEDVLGHVAADDGLCRSSPEACMIAVDSDDEIGESAEAFNRVVGALALAMQTQSAVKAFSDMLAGELEIKSLAEHALRQILEHSNAAAGLILCRDDGDLNIASSHGFRDSAAIAASEYVRLAADRGEQRVVRSPEEVLIDGVDADLRPVELLVLRIEHKNVFFGVIVLAATHSFDTNERERIDLFLQGLGLALNNAVAHDNLQRLAVLDPLTGIYNRRFGLERLCEEYARAVRAHSRLGVLMLDIDHFKTVNDIYGHLAGDRILKSICSIARSSLRQGDVLLRYGGEEFTAILPAASVAEVRDLGERLRRSVEEHTFVDGANTVNVTVSVGGVAYPDHDVDGEDGLIRLADAAPYRAKDLGRNRVEMAPVGESAVV